MDPLRIESGPSWRACFWSLHFVRCAEVLQAAMCAECGFLALASKLEATDTNSIRGRTLELFEALVADLVAMMCASFRIFGSCYVAQNVQQRTLREYLNWHVKQAPREAPDSEC